ncbi:hypothetical protein THAOC_36865 [Thalassiosira oceanica]|uniref:Uncharacterized protein n=1 Tax=Thalassiosira oceanica TaxID=159749 RepID=K0R157_THAOC|nr:hypothetical protein THAOC_36865 [Thalassiosira oceanica]|eukprot:EJK44584.1 hypothetical protein THAOC_36865 [Thalassiosira oceanica]
MALRPTLSIKRAGATANSLIIERARPAEVPEPLITAACPSGTIYTSFQPDICAGILSGTSAAFAGWPPVRVWICRSDDAAAMVNSSISLLSMLPTAVRWRLVVEEQFASP